MESLKKQAAKLLGEQKKYRRWLAVFLCLAVLVTAGTTAALKMNGQALSHKQKVLDCGLEVHEHTAACYESGVIPAEGTASQGEEKPVCGYADYVVHTHNDDCYSADGELVCQLPEVENHVHGDECYQEQEVLVCEKEETPGHQHTEECRKLICGKEESQGHQHTEACRTLICGKEETQGHQHTDACRTLSQGELICQNTEEGHEHTAECYEQVETITCGQEETEAHVHDESCYDFSACSYAGTEEEHIHTEECYDPYACGLEEGAEGHTHTEECYEKKRVLICGKLELHTHVTPEEAADGQESCYDAEGNLICGIPELKEHVHGEDCFVTTELTKEEVEAMQGSEDTEQDAEKVEESSIEQTLYQKTYEDESVKIVAAYYGSANIPVEAELYAEMTEQKAAAETELPADAETELPADADADVDNAENAPDSGAVNGTEENGDAGDAGAEGTSESGEDDGTAEGVEPVSEEVEPGSETETDGTADAAEIDGDPQVKGRTELVAGEATYKIGFRLDGAEIVPEDTVTFTIWNLEEEGSEPETIAYSAEDGFENMTVTVGRMVEVFVQTEFQKVYEDESIRVIAQYEDTAEIPVEAELKVKRITSESDPEHFAMREEEFKEQVGDENATMDALLNIGFYVGEAEIEPRGKVAITIQFLDSEGIVLGAPIDIIHFAEDGTEVLDASDVDENGTTTFHTNTFSDFACMFEVSGNSGDVPELVLTGDDYAYNQPDVLPFYWMQNGSWVRYTDPTGGWKEPIIGGTNIFEVSYPLEQCGCPESTLTVDVSRQIGVRYTNDKGEDYITTAVYKGGYWSIENPAGTVTGIYYLSGNETSYNIPFSELTLGALPCEVVFNPGNGGLSEGDNAFKLKTAYGVIAPVEFTIPATADQNGFASIRLPGDDELGTDFNFNPDENSQEWKYRIERESGYDFRLVGWYDILNKKYYSVENGSVTVNIPTGGKSVFYGDWVAASYSVPEGKKGLTGSEDVSEFVTTRVFDYNELFNVYSAQYQAQSDQWEMTQQFQEDMGGGTLKNPEGYALQLQSTGRSNFPFIETINPENALWTAKNAIIAPLKWNNDTHNSSAGNGCQDILSGGINDILLSYLFPEGEAERALGVHYLGYGDGLYQHYDTDADHVGENYIGYYEYDSEKNSALYDKTDGRFYISSQQNIVRTQNSSVSYHSSFLPFNYEGTDLKEDGNGVNYHFGMCSEIDFYLPSKPGESYEDASGNKVYGNSIDDSNMIFEFSGDDDVWVFVDDKLVLDLGGIHGKVSGEINFSTGQVTDVHNNGGVNSEKSALLQTLEGGKNHKLTIYYLERGAGLSNCKIKFNIVPRYKLIPPTANTVTVNKVWIDSNDDSNNPSANDNTLHAQDTVTVCLQDRKGNEIPDSEAVLSIKNGWSYTWEALPPKSNYSVVEKNLKSGYEPAYKVDMAYRYRYWAEADTMSDEGKDRDEIVILNREEGTAKALSKDGSAKELSVSEGVIQSSDLTDEIIWIVQKVEGGYTLQNKSSGKYLNIDSGQLNAAAENAGVFNLAPEAMIRLNSGEYRLVYQDEFKSEVKSGNNNSNSNAENISVRVFRYHEVDSIVKNYTITNTYVPAFTIKKVDAVNTDEELTGAKFILTRTYERKEIVEEVGEDGKEVPVEKTVYKWGYYKSDGTWVDSSAESLAKAKELAAAVTKETEGAEFEINGSLRLQEMLSADYTLTETVPPDGYQLPEGGNKICFTVDGSVKGDTIQCGKLTIKGEDKKDIQVSIAEVDSNDSLILLVRNEKLPVTTARIRLLKYSKGANDGTPLGGASFNLYKFLTKEEIAEAEKNDETLTTIKPDGKDLTVKPITENLKPESASDVGPDKGLFFDGELSCGIYYLEETRPPAGYNIIVGMLKFEIKDENGTLSVTTANNSTDIISPADPVSDKDNVYYQIKIFNTEGFKLPETGSLGTKPFTIGGAMLITATAILMYGYSVRRKKSERRLKK